MGAKLKDEYEQDFYAWAFHNADLIRREEFSEIDIENVSEELESMGRSIRNQLINRLAVLLAHLLKWQFQPNMQSRSWKNTIAEQRFRAKKVLKENPSLKHDVDLKLAEAYELALFEAIRETGLSEKAFPKCCPFAFDECLDENFFPES